MPKKPIDTGDIQSGKITKKEKPDYFIMALMLLPVFAAVLAFMAMLGLQNEYSIGGVAKAAFIAVAAGLVSYCINRFAIDWGAELAANGFVTAGVFSVFSILAVGACLWAFTYAGMTLPDVRQLRLEDHGQALISHIDLRNQNASKASAIAPTIKAAANDLAYHADCEEKNSCVSGRGNGGRGTITRILEERASRAAEIASQLDSGLSLRTETLAALNELVGDYQQVLGDGALSAAEKRRKLIALDAEIGQALATLDQAVPLGLITAYGIELERGIDNPGRPEATRAINALLGKHGKAIGSEMAKLELAPIKRPAFPAKAGIADTFDYIGHFAAIAGVIWVAEGIFPLALWLYTLLYLIRHYQWGDRDPRTPSGHGTHHNGPNPKSLNGTGEPRPRRSNRHNGYNGHQINAGAYQEREPRSGGAVRAPDDGVNQTGDAWKGDHHVS